MSKCIFSYTAPFYPLPEYINIYAQDNGSNIVTVRSMGTNDTSKVNLPPDQLKALADAIYAHLELNS